MAVEIVRNERQIEQLLQEGSGFVNIEDPVSFVSGLISLGQDRLINVRTLVPWLNEVVMRWPSEHSRSELLASSLNSIYGQDWRVVAANPMRLIYKHGESLEELASRDLQRRFPNVPISYYR